MGTFKIPFKISCNDIYQQNHTDDVELSIRSIITVLVDSANGSYKPDFDFGFTLKNTRFENSTTDDCINRKKLTGNSLNTNCYAFDLKEAILKFEPRLLEPLVEMSFVRKTHVIVVKISGKYKNLAGDIKKFTDTKRFYIW